MVIKTCNSYYYPSQNAHSVFDIHEIKPSFAMIATTFPISYLGLPVSDKRLRVSDWEFLTGKVGHRVDPWQGLFLASAGRVELTNSCLSGLPM
jgi:hypothetical protein